MGRCAQQQGGFGGEGGTLTWKNFRIELGNLVDLDFPGAFVLARPDS